MRNDESFSSRIGFILTSAGCAIGLGNIWRFPFIVGKNGGSIFVFIYLVFLLILGLPVMTTEFAVGRASKTSAVKAFEVLKNKKSKWNIVGFLSFIGCYMLMFYYVAISGWMLSYVFKMLRGDFLGGQDTTEIFHAMLKNPVSMIFWAYLVIIIGFMVCFFGFNKGVETISKWMMSCLLILILIMAVKAFTLPNSMEGLKFYLIPNIENIKHVGFGTVVTEAMNQAFFTLSLGIGAMEIFGSRIDGKKSLFGESLWIGILDTFVAFVAGCIIFPATSAFQIPMDQGPSLIFVTLPRVFQQMTAGRFWGALFFIFMSMAALTTIIAVFEALTSYLIDKWNVARTTSIVINLIILAICVLPAIFGYNILEGISPLGVGTTILDFEDFIVSNNILPLGALGYLLFCVTDSGMGFDTYLKHANEGDGTKIGYFLRPYFQYVLPLIIIIIIVLGYVFMFLN